MKGTFAIENVSNKTRTKSFHTDQRHPGMVLQFSFRPEINRVVVQTARQQQL